MAAHCRYHCSPCGRHFSSLDAFDLHHVRDDTGWPVCVDPIDLEEMKGKPILAVLTTDGVCDVYAEKVENVTIWARAGKDGEVPRRPAETLPTSAKGA
jgi:hypothetical protein